MARKTVRLIMFLLMALLLLTVSCGPAATPITPPTQTAPTTPATKTAPTTPTTPVAENPQKEAVKPTSEVPKYGGTLVLGLATEPINYDALRDGPFGTQVFQLTNEKLWRGNWAKGTAGGYGTGETSWTINNDQWDIKAGYLAESWQMNIGDSTSSVVWNIRKGVRYALNPASEASRLVGGREVTVDDIIFSTTTVFTDNRAYLYQSDPALKDALANGQFKITSPGPRQVKWEIPTNLFYQLMYRVADYSYIVPPEVWKKFGGMSDWRNSVGTGAFILTDVVPGSSKTLKRNPNYWMQDPVGPGKGNQLPYVDGVKWLIIPDASTLMAAFRVGKVDHLPVVSWEDALTLEKQRPEIKANGTYSATPVSMIGMRVDKTPFNDIRVRQALMLAIDFNGIRKNYFGGTAQIMTWPYPWIKDYAAALINEDEAPAAVKELYSYNPEKAKALLKEAGYPNGLKAELILPSTQQYVDYYSIYKDMWSKVGVDVTFNIKATAPMAAIVRARDYQEMEVTGGQPGVVGFSSMLTFRGTGENNASYVDDPTVEAAFQKMQKLIITDTKAAYQLNKELMTHVLAQVWRIPRVMAPEYALWWPWVKGYSGEDSVGNANRIWSQYIWYDQELKKSMGY